MKVLRKITDKKILYLVTFCIIVILPILKLASFYFVKYDLLDNYDKLNVEYILFFSIPILLYLYIKDLIITKRKLTIYDYLFYILVASGIIATIFSIDIKIAILGKSYRHEGFLSILCYYLLFITWTVMGTKTDLKKIIIMLILIALLNAIYSLLQIYTSTPLILRYAADKQMASGIISNPNFFGSLIVTILSIITTKYLLNEKNSILEIITIIILFIALNNAQSTGPFLTYPITILFILIYLFIKKKLIIKKLLYLVVILVILYPSLLYFNENISKIEKCEMCDFTKNVASNIDEKNTKEEPNNSEESSDKETSGNTTTKNSYSISNGRIQIWIDSLNMVKSNLITGVGYDNYYLEYYENVNLSEVVFVSIDGVEKAFPKYTTLLDNAHNVYLHILVSSGIIGIIPYLVLCLLTFIKCLKTKDSLVMCLLGGFVAYSIQAFANISVIQVAPIYYIIIGLILSTKEQSKNLT